MDCDDNKPCVAADPLTPCSEQEKRDARTICEAIKRFFEDDEEAKVTRIPFVLECSLCLYLLFYYIRQIHF